MSQFPIALVAADVPTRAKRSLYPEPFNAMMSGREKRVLGDPFGLTNYGVNLTRLKPGGLSALRHAHAKQDEFVYALEGEAVLVTDAGETPLTPGMCAGFKAGTGDGHHIINRGTRDFVYLEIGDRSAGDSCAYPDNDLRAEQRDGNWAFLHKDGTAY